MTQKRVGACFHNTVLPLRPLYRMPSQLAQQESEMQEVVNGSGAGKESSQEQLLPEALRRSLAWIKSKIIFELSTYSRYCLL